MKTDKKRKKMLIVAMGNSIHTVRWVSMLTNLDCDIHLFNSFTIPFVGYETRYPDNVTLHNFESIKKKTIRFAFRHPFRFCGLWRGFNTQRMKDNLVIAIRGEDKEKLAKFLEKNDFDVIHTLHTQTSAALLQGALELTGKTRSVWMHSVWGSDLYLYQWLPGKAELQKLLPHMDYYWGEGRRDYALARELGFRGAFLPPVPAFGGFDMNELTAERYISPSKRKKIMVKGYLNVVGRADIAFHALEACADLLGDYEIILFSYENAIMTTIVDVFAGKTGTKVRYVHNVPYQEILRLHSESRLYIGLSTSDGLPASFMESMACGEFPIQSNTSMGNEWAEHGEGAFFVSPSDVREVAACIRVALTDDALVDRAGDVNRRRIMQYCNDRDISKKVTEVYGGILAQAPIVDDAGSPEAITENKPTEADANAPLVSVIMITYKHRDYIARAIEGVVNQKTDFPFELLIGEDCSGDETADIVAEYAEKYPDIIQALIREANIGAIPNFKDLVSRSRGRYVAVCDGDDYWTDMAKLQKQVDFLKEHPDCSACCHVVRQVFEDHSAEDVILHPLDLAGRDAKKRGYLTIHDLIKMNTVASLSAMYRWSIQRNLPDWMDKYIVADYPTLLMHADKGNVGVLLQEMGTYRKHSGGSWVDHNSSKQLRDFARLLLDIDNELDQRYHDEIMSIINLMQRSNDTGELHQATRPAQDQKSPLHKRVVGRLPMRLQELIYSVYHVKNLYRVILRIEATEAALMKDLAEQRALEENLRALEENQRAHEENLRAHEENQRTLKAETARVRDANAARTAEEARKETLLSEALTYLQQAQFYGVPTDFAGRLEYLIATSNFNRFYQNYDEDDVDKEACLKWIESVKLDYTRTVPVVQELIGAERLKRLEASYELLTDEASKDIFVRLIIWRILGFTKIKLLTDQEVERGESFLADSSAMILQDMPSLRDVRFDLMCYDLSRIGYPIRCYTMKAALLTGFVRRQYEHEHVRPEPRDTVLDCGGCWGDTALWLADICGGDGKVYSFEFVPANIDVFKKNLELNPRLAERVEIVPHPVARESGRIISFSDNGSASTIEGGESKSDMHAATISIDDFVAQRELEKVDFIKMDIEGSELEALEGARKTIERCRPRLAISVYHKQDDLWQIPKLLKEMCPEYSLYINHYTRESWETILFAACK